MLDLRTIFFGVLIMLSSLIYSSAETLEVIYRWQEPANDVDEIVFKRLQKTLDKEQAYYYYIMYARSKDDILLSRTPNLVNQAWIPRTVLLDSKEITYQEYLHLVDLTLSPWAHSFTG